MAKAPIITGILLIILSGIIFYSTNYHMIIPSLALALFGLVLIIFHKEEEKVEQRIDSKIKDLKTRDSLK